MAATATLSTTSFLSTVQPLDTAVNLSSTSGIVPGVRLFVDREMITVRMLTGIGNWATVARGQDGTETRRHATNAVVYIGRGDQFYESDPQGMPPAVILVSPHINIRTGVAWMPIGDEVGPGADTRNWQPITSTQTPGSFGIRVDSTVTPS